MKSLMPVCFVVICVTVNGCTHEASEKNEPIAAAVAPTKPTDEVPAPVATKPDATDLAAAEPAEPSQSDAIAPAEWLELHEIALGRPGSNAWRNAVIRLKEVGDGISFDLLRKLKSPQLTDDDRQAILETMAAIEQRLDREDDATTVALLKTRLERAALADLTCHRLEGPLVPWTLKYIHARAQHPPVRDKLEQLRAEYKATAKNETDAETEYGYMSDRIQAYIARVLKESDDGFEATR